MLSHYQTLEAIARLERIGPPEWEDCNADGSKRTLEHRIWLNTVIGFQYVADHVALCLLRNHLREWLERRAVQILVDFNGKRGPSTTYYLERDLCNEDGYYEGDGGREVLTVAGWHRWNKLGDAVPRYFDDLDAALLAGAE